MRAGETGSRSPRAEVMAEETRLGSSEGASTASAVGHSDASAHSATNESAHGESAAMLGGYRSHRRIGSGHGDRAQPCVLHSYRLMPPSSHLLPHSCELSTLALFLRSAVQGYTVTTSKPAVVREAEEVKRPRSSPATVVLLQGSPCAEREQPRLGVMELQPKSAKPMTHCLLKSLSLRPVLKGEDPIIGVAYSLHTARRVLTTALLHPRIQGIAQKNIRQQGADSGSLWRFLLYRLEVRPPIRGQHSATDRSAAGSAGRRYGAQASGAVRHGPHGRRSA